MALREILIFFRVKAFVVQAGISEESAPAIFAITACLEAVKIFLYTVNYGKEVYLNRNVFLEPLPEWFWMTGTFKIQALPRSA